jgi:hypothetical protein
MDYSKINSIGTIMIAFSTFIGGLIALIYYFFIITEFGILGVLIIGIIYIDINLLFLYTLKLKGVFK